jgi:hypothetical protein
MKEKMLNEAFWAADIDSAAVESALDSMARESRQRREEDSLSAVLQTVQAPTSPNTKENPNVLPTLKKHGASPEDRCVHENLLGDLRVLNEMTDIAEERTLLQDAVPRTKAAAVEAKKVSAAERKKTENGETFGQPANAKMDEVLKKNGTDRAAQFGGTTEGNGARRLMERGAAIINEMVEHVLQAPTRFAGTNDEIRHAGEMHLLQWPSDETISLDSRHFGKNQSSAVIAFWPMKDILA